MKQVKTSRKQTIIDKIEKAMVREYGDTLRDYGTSVAMAERVYKSIKSELKK